VKNEFEVNFYDKADGTEPAKDFLKSLDAKMRAKMARTINILQANGEKLREPYSKSLDGGIFELRAKIGTDISRILYFFTAERNIVLTNGFIKKTQKTPVSEIERAKIFRTEYLNRKGEDNEHLQ
jgi:phage-related protein